MNHNIPGSKTVIRMVLIVTLTAMVHSTTSADASTVYFSFTPIHGSANFENWDSSAPWKLPDGYSQAIISDEKSLNIYRNGKNDFIDMITVNESGPMAGRFMYRTHEIKKKYGGSAVSVVDLKNKTSRILFRDVKFNKLDGIRWTPWNTILVAEEVKGGRLFEVTLNKDMVSTASVDFRPALGLLAHEGIEVDADGNVYVVDEHRGLSRGCKNLRPCGGGVYKFVPVKYGDLTKGSLYVLKVTGPDGTGQGEWVGPIDPAKARISGSQMGGQSYQRPEDLEIIGNKLYVAITEGPRNWKRSEQYEGRVISIDLKTLAVRDFIKPGLNVPVEKGKPGQKGHQTGWKRPDNLAESPDGRLVIVEDNAPADIWFASTQTDINGASKNVSLFASLSDPGAEGSGVYFSKDPDTLYVNVMHSAAPDGDATWAITRISEK